MVFSTEYIQGLSRYRGSVSALSAGAYTTTLYVIVNKVKGRGLAPLPPPSPAWADFYIMIECMPESDRCHSVYSVVFMARGSNITTVLYFSQMEFCQIEHTLDGLLTLKRPFYCPMATKVILKASKICS